MNSGLEIIRTYWSQIALTGSVFGSIYIYLKNSTKREKALKIDDNIILEGDIKNVSALLQLHRETIEDLRKSFDTLKKEYIKRGKAYDDLESRFNKVTQILASYDSKIKILSDENSELIKRAEKCEECPVNNQ